MQNAPLTSVLSPTIEDWPLGRETIAGRPIDVEKFVRRLRTGAVIIPAIFLFLLHGYLLRLLIRSPNDRRRRLIKNVSVYSRFALRQLRITVKPIGVAPESENFLIVSNHLSYVDLMVLASIRPSVFVTSIDMGQVFFLGTMAEIGGSLFIERRNRERIDRDVAQIADCLRLGEDVVLFPEGTSGNGKSVLPFKKPLLMAAPAAGRRILPVTLRYNRIDGEPLCAANHSRICWYGRMGFLPHFLELLTFKGVDASVEFHQPFRAAPTDTKDELARLTQKTILEAYLKT